MATDLRIFCVESCRRQLAEQKKLLDFSLDVICSFDADGRFISVTAACRKVWGYEPEELIGRRYLELVLPEDQPATIDMVAAIMSGVNVTNFQNRYLRKDGTVVPVLWSARWDEEDRIIYCVAKDATEKVEAERQARLHEEKLYQAYKLAKIGWWEWDEATQNYSISDELYEIYGLDKQSLPHFNRDDFFSMVFPADREAVTAAIQTFRQQQYGQFDHRLVRPDGSVIHVIHYVEVVRDAAGSLLQIHGTTKNITERKTAEEALKRSEHRLRRILESIDDGFFAVDKNWTVTYWNRRAEDVLQRRREDIVGRNLWEEYQKAIPLKFYTEYHRAMAGNHPVHFEEYFPPLEMWAEVSAFPSADGLSVYFKDITSRKQQQEALKESIQRYSYVSKATSDAIWDWDIAAEAIYWGEGFETNFGYRLADLVPSIRNWTDNIHPGDKDRVTASLGEVIKSPKTNWIEEYRFCRVDGTYAYVVDKGFVIRDPNGRALRMVGAMQDITRQKEAELAMKFSEEQFRLLFFLSPKPKWMFEDATWRIVEVNQAAVALYGYSREEFLQLSIADLKVPEDLPELHALREKGGSQYHDIVRHRKKSGEVFYIEINTHAIDLPAGRHFLVAGDDVSDKLRLQQKLLEGRVAAQKEVARVILDTQERERSEIGKELHDNVNQLLTTAKLYIENIRYFPDQKEAFVEKGVALLQRSIDEIRFLSKQLVTPVMNDIGFEATIDELISHYKSLRLFEIELHYAVCEKFLDKGLKLTIFRIIQEQLNNVVKYANASLVTVDILYREHELHVAIRDNGIGFDSKKAGNGLGLKNIKNRAEVYKGRLHIEASVGNGSTVAVCFPVDPDREA